MLEAKDTSTQGPRMSGVSWQLTRDAEGLAERGHDLFLPPWGSQLHLLSCTGLSPMTVRRPSGQVREAWAKARGPARHWDPGPAPAAVLAGELCRDACKPPLRLVPQTPEGRIPSGRGG